MGKEHVVISSASVLISVIFTATVTKDKMSFILKGIRSACGFIENTLCTRKVYFEKTQEENVAR